MRPSRLAVLFPLVALVGGCGDQSGQAPDPAGADVATWASMGLPWLEADLEADPPRTLVRYGDASHALDRPFADGSRPITMTATAESALVQLGQVTGPTEIFTLERAGAWTRVGRGASTLVVADRDGTLAAWTELRGDRHVLVAFDTGREQVVGTAPVAEDAAVTAVEGDTVWFSDDEATARWVPGGAPERLTSADDPGAWLVTDRSAAGAEARLLMDAGGRLQVLDPAGEVVARFSEGMSQGFSPDGALLLVSDDQRVVVVDASSGETTEVTGYGGDEYAQRQPTFGLDGTVLVTVNRGGDDADREAVSFHTCQAPDWSCEDFHHPVGWYETALFPSGFLGQFAWAYERDGLACEGC